MARGNCEYQVRTTPSCTELFLGGRRFLAAWLVVQFALSGRNSIGTTIRNRVYKPSPWPICARRDHHRQTWRYRLAAPNLLYRSGPSKIGSNSNQYAGKLRVRDERRSRVSVCAGTIDKFVELDPDHQLFRNNGWQLF